MEVKELMQLRTELDHDVINNVIPKRVPINISMSMNAIAEYGGVDPKLVYWEPTLLEKVSEKLCEEIPSDTCLLSRVILNPAKYQALGSKAVVLGKNGFMQHPNTHMMEENEYEEFICDPYAFIVSKAAPRVNENLDFKKNPLRAAMTISQANSAMGAVMSSTAAMNKRLAERFGYAQKPGGASNAYAPMDILSDQLRSFTGMSIDIRRNRAKVKDAIEAVSPLNYFIGLPVNPNITRDSYGFYPLHMATFMRIKDFEELWWPSFKRQWDNMAAMGYRCGAFLEDNWNHLLDYLTELPTGSVFTFEFTDHKKLKEKLGKKFVLGSGFPIQYLSKSTKEECIDKTKAWLDVMAPGAQYSFGFDKSILTIADCNVENLKAVAETVLSYGVYDNPGTPTGDIYSKSDYSVSMIAPFASSAYKTWEQYKAENPDTTENAKSIVMSAEEAIVRFYYSLMM